MRRCARCRVEMQTVPFRGAHVDLCPQCRAVFLDPGEAETVHGVDEARAFLEHELAEEVGPSELPCPAHEDEVKMTVYVVRTFADPVEVDRCSTCGGLFLDAGEGQWLERMARIARAEDEDRARTEGTAEGGRFLLPPDGDIQARVVAEARSKGGKSVVGELWTGLLRLVTGGEKVEAGRVGGALAERPDFVATTTGPPDDGEPHL